jgi:hypothetical protein
MPKLDTGLGSRCACEGRARKKCAWRQSVEVRIGVQHANRELVIESAQQSSEVEDVIAAALKADDGLLVLADEKGRRVVVPAAKLAFVEIGEESSRRVGFGASG